MAIEPRDLGGLSMIYIYKKIYGSESSFGETIHVWW